MRTLFHPKSFGAIAVMCAALIGCSKEDSPIVERAPRIQGLSTNNYYSYDGVTCENGLLTFVDQQAFDATVAHLAGEDESQTPPIYYPPTSPSYSTTRQSQNTNQTNFTIPSGFEDDNTIIQDSAAVAFESRFPCYTSLRLNIENQQRALMDAGQWSETNDPDDFFIDDSMLRLLLNENSEVKIGSSIFIISNDKTTIEIKNDDWNTLNLYRNHDPSYQNSPNYSYYVSPSGTTTASRTQNCVADFQFTRRGDGITFDFVASNSGTSSQTYFWDFGDNTTSTINTPSHVYRKPGRYVVTLRFTDANCSPYSTTKIIETTNNFCTTPIQPDAADFTFTNTGYAAKFTLTKNYTSQYSYVFDFGDGHATIISSANNRGTVFYNTYPKGGTYSGRLYVYNSQGCLLDKGFQINIPTETCEWPAFQRDKGWLKYDNGNKQFKYKLWATNTVFYHRVGAKTKNYEKRSNGNWKDRKATRIYAEVNGLVYLQSCTALASHVEDYGTNFHDQRNKKSTDVEVGLGSRFYLKNGSLGSKHFIEYNGILYPNDRSLKLLN